MNLRRILSHLVSLFALVATFGCATGTKFTGPKAAHDDTALLYVFRPSNPPLALKPAIMVNGIRAADLTNKGYFDLELQPGAYVIKADWSWASGVPDSELTLQAEKGRTYYVLIDSSMHTSGFVATGVTVVPILNFKGGIGLVDSEVATAMITPCGAVKNFPASKT
jgi:hypothetical protein